MAVKGADEEAVTVDPATVVVYTRAVLGTAHSELVRGLTGRLRSYGYRVIAVPTRYTPQDEAEPWGGARFDLPVALGHTGAVVVVSASASGSLLDQISIAGIPLVLADRASDRIDLPLIRSDDAGATHLAVGHLVEHGRTRIGFLGTATQPEARRRYAAYHAAVLRHGLLPDPEDEFLLTQEGFTAGHRVARTLAARSERPTGMLVSSDDAARGLLAGLAEAGLRVPQDVAVISYGNSDEGAFTSPPLTSVDLRPLQVGERTARLVRRALAGDHPRPGVRVAHSAVLVLRRSCGCGTGRAGEVEHAVLARPVARAAAVWYERAGRHLARAMASEQSQHYQQRLDIALLGDPDVSRLGWLRHTQIRVAALALWRDRVAETLTVVGWHGADQDLAALGGQILGSATTAWDFPPRSLVAATDGRPEEQCLVVPVATAERDWGLLAIAADATIPYGGERVLHWASLLANALEREELAESIRRSEARYATASRAGNDGLWEFRIRDGTSYASERTREMLGALPGTTVTPEWWLTRIHPDDRDGLVAMINESIRRPTVPVALEYRLGSPDEGYRWVVSRALGVTGPGGATERVVGSLSDIHHRRSLEERLRYSALHDPLTGLANRAEFNARIADALAGRAAGAVSSVGLVFFDLDGFKEVNDHYGHLAGDDLLRTVADRLPGVLREGDLPARYGGDEFAVLVLDASTEDLVRVAERIRAVIAEPITLDGTTVCVTASTGVVGPRPPGVPAREILRDADAAMYRAKFAGGDRVVLAEDPPVAPPEAAEGRAGEVVSFGRGPDRGEPDIGGETT